MNRIFKNTLLRAALFLWLLPVSAQNGHPVISAIQKEVDRNKTELRMEGMASPFFISYSIIDRQDFSISASLGTIAGNSESRQRRGVPMLLVGDYLRNNLNTPPRQVTPPLTSLYDNATGIPITIWGNLDGVYKAAVEQYQSKIAIQKQQTQTEEEKNLPDFLQTPPVNMVLPPAKFDFNRTYWENFLRKASETAKRYPDILTSNVSLNAQNVMIYTYNTEGSRYAVPSTFYQLIFTANTRAADGQELTHTIYVENASFEQMPDLATFTNQCKTLMENLLKLKDAPVIDDAYSGPVLFEGSAVERIFRQALFNNNKLAAAPKMVQPQQQGSQGGNDFEMMLNKKVMSRNITVKSITGQEFYKGQRLNGYYPVDAEGVVPDKELVLIENGVLRNMLNGRKPTKKIGQSNGHTRYDYNANNLRVMPGNILITSNQTYSNDELRKLLFAAAKEEDLDYAYIVRQYEGGINMMYRIYLADGREELVRGATISDDANLKTFKRILGASDREQMVSFGSVQTTVIVPDGLLFEEMDITRMPNIEFKKPYIVSKPN
jgi:hypothetical protein